MEVTHIVLPLEAYQKLGQWMRKQPFEDIAPVIQFVQSNASAVGTQQLKNGVKYVPVNDGAAE